MGTPAPVGDYAEALRELLTMPNEEAFERLVVLQPGQWACNNGWKG
jgi:hypothetical protein